MFASNASPLRWPKRIVLGTVGIFLLVQVVLRILRRAAPGPMPSRLAPLLTTPLRLRLFGSPERVSDRARVTPNMRVLEVGPGPGVYTVPLALRVASSEEDGSVTCLEIQPEMIEMLRDHLQAPGIGNVEVVRGDGRQMPLPDESFDMVFVVDVVGEIPDKSTFFSECARVLKVGGTLAVTEQISDPDFRLPHTVRKLATEAGLREEGRVGLPWWTYTARYRK
ncbi:MAG TPA: methyltransferase domain-containing protein [Rubrobacter sp.]|nr:methyltransferase domain-containing protein [Rubrobacter sp.]